MSDRTTFVCPHCHQPALIIEEDAYDVSDVGGAGIEQMEDDDPSDDELTTTPTAKSQRKIGFK